MKKLLLLLAIFLSPAATYSQDVSPEWRPSDGLVPVVAPVNTQLCDYRHSHQGVEDFTGPTGSPWAASFKVRSFGGYDDAGREMFGSGSGTGIAKYIILTNYHVVDDAIAHNKRTVQLTNSATGVSRTGQVLGGNKAIDLAFVRVMDGEVPYVRMAYGKPDGDLWLFGYTQGGEMRSNSRPGKIVGTMNQPSRGRLNYITSVTSIPGDSGGGLFDSKGILRAINWGGDLEEGVGSVSVSVEHVWGEWDKMETACGSQGCQPIRRQQRQQRPTQEESGGWIQPKQPVHPTTPPTPIIEPTPPPTPVEPPPPAPDVVTKDELNIIIANLQLQIQAASVSEELDIDALAEQVLSKLPPIGMEVHNPDGSVSVATPIEPMEGGTWKLRLFESDLP